jgi:hypothetical protein
VSKRNPEYADDFQTTFPVPSCRAETLEWAAAAGLYIFPNLANLCARKSAAVAARLKSLVRKDVKVAVTTPLNRISTPMGHSGITTDNPAANIENVVRGVPNAPSG